MEREACSPDRRIWETAWKQAEDSSFGMLQLQAFLSRGLWFSLDDDDPKAVNMQGRVVLNISTLSH